MSDREFFKLFSGLLGVLVALTAVLFLLANVVGGGIATANAANDDKGKAVFSASCVACHGTGVAGAPKIGDKAAWKNRIAQGKSTLYKHALGGFQGKSGLMPPKGGNAGLPDADVKAAVDYMVSKAE